MPTCKVIIQDEVNVKITDLDLDTRKALVKKFKYEDPTARYRPAFKLGRWDGTISFFGLGGTTYLSMLGQVLEYLESKNYYIEVNDCRESPPLEFNEIFSDFWGDKTWPEGHRFAGEPIRLREDQVEVVNIFLKNPQCMQEIATGFGKCQPLDSNVLTPSGWKQMRDIQLGDLVLTPSGKSVKVIETYMPGIKDIFEITFKDGRTARACKDHLWKVHNIDWTRSKKGPWRNITTEEIMNLQTRTNRPLSIPLISLTEDESVDIELPIDPWLMGFLLGDGSFRNNHLGFSTADLELVEKVKSKLLDGYMVKHIANYDYSIQFVDIAISRKLHSENMSNKLRNSLGHILPDQKSSSNIYIQKLIDLGLMEKLSHEKFIPDIYFRGSLYQRMELIRGLADSDGTVEKTSIALTSTSSELAEGFQKLIHSIGGIARISHSSNRFYTYNGVKIPCKDAYYVPTRFSEPWKLVSLKRKQDITNYSYQYQHTLRLQISSIKKVSTEEVKCIMIDHPDHLYITDNYVVTHNTITTATLSKICEKYGRTITIVPNKDLVVQTEEDFINCGLDVGVYFGDRKDLGKTHTICTWQSLNILDKKSLNATEEDEILTLAEMLDGVQTVMVDECFDKNSKVLTPNGYVEIKKIKPGDSVINYSEDTKEFKIDTVVAQHKNLTNSSSEKMYQLVFDNDSVINVTGNHKFLTKDGWIRADQLTENHEIISANINTHI